MACILVWKQLLSIFCRQEVAACFRLVSVANHLLAKMLRKGSRGVEVMGHELGTVEMVVPNLCAVAP